MNIVPGGNVQKNGHILAVQGVTELGDPNVKPQKG